MRWRSSSPSGSRGRRPRWWRRRRDSPPRGHRQRPRRRWGTRARWCSRAGCRSSRGCSRPRRAPASWTGPGGAAANHTAEISWPQPCAPAVVPLLAQLAEDRAASDVPAAIPAWVCGRSRVFLHVAGPQQQRGKVGQTSPRFEKPLRVSVGCSALVGCRRVCGVWSTWLPRRGDAVPTGRGLQ